jgi:hypothetical protein
MKTLRVNSNFMPPHREGWIGRKLQATSAWISLRSPLILANHPRRPDLFDTSSYA